MCSEVSKCEEEPVRAADEIQISGAAGQVSGTGFLLICFLSYFLTFRHWVLFLVHVVLVKRKCLINGTGGHLDWFLHPESPPCC